MIVRIQAGGDAQLWSIVLLQWVALAFVFAFNNTRNSKPTRMMTSSSIKVKASVLYPGFLDYYNIRLYFSSTEKSRKNFLTKDGYFRLNQTNSRRFSCRLGNPQVFAMAEEIMIDGNGLDS